MKKIITGLLVVAATVAGASAMAQSSDDKKWVAQCVRDNKDEGAKAGVVRKYCECMNDKMDETETRSISQWEKANPAAMKACEREAGWK
ncbi:MAG: hypothetical protein PHU77_05110 [Simplicispira sp.]|nr:hypothetical protein [Simplicispira sp.]